jgi:glyoxylase I family protein
MIVGVHHIAVGVSDMDKAIAFYSQAFGFEVVQHADLDNDPAADQIIGLEQVKAKMVMLKAPNVFVELWQYTQPLPEDRRSRPCDYGYPHFALQIDDIEFEYDRLRGLGMEFVGDAVVGEQASAIYGRDPFGNVIELYEIKTEDLPQLKR